MKLFLNLPIPWFWKPRDCTLRAMPLAWLSALVRLAGARVASIPIAQKMVSIHSQPQKIDLRATRKAWVLLLVKCQQRTNTLPSLCFAFRLSYLFHWASHCSLLLSLGVQCISVGQWNIFSPS